MKSKQKRSHNHRQVRSGYPYTYREISTLFGVTLSTVHRWRRQGLQVIDESSTPRLVLGKELIRFLNQRKTKRQIKLKPGEFNCRRCRAARRSIGDRITIVMHRAEFSPGNHKAEILGRCEVCGLQVRLFSSEKTVRGMIGAGKIILEHGKGIKWDAGSSINASFSGVHHE